MPISHEHRVLFIHIPKNAGKAFEIFLGIHDSFKGSPNSRSKINALSKFILSRTSNSKALNILMGTIDKSFAAQHLTLQEIILGNWVSYEVLNTYKRVAIVRDPFHRAYSLFNHNAEVIKSKDSVELEFNRFLKTVTEKRNHSKHSISCLFRQQSEFLRDIKGCSKSVLTIQLEQLDLGIEKFCLQHDLKILLNNQLPKYKESNNSLREAALSERNKVIIKDLFPEDLIFATT